MKSKDETRVMVRTYSDKSLGAYYHYDRKSGDLQKLAEVSPWLKGPAGRHQPIQYQSRDGLTIIGI